MIDLIKTRNTPDIDAKIFSFNFDPNISEDKDFPRQVSDLTGGTYSRVDEKLGDTDVLLQNAVRSYYLYYAFGNAQDNSDVVVTSPYLDFSSGVAMITMSLPVYFEDFFIGVVGVDIPLTFLSEAVGDAVIGRQSYLFVVNQEAEVILHPLVPDPLTTIFSVGDEYKPVYIGDLEPDEFDVESMLSANEGHQKIEGLVGTPVCHYFLVHCFVPFS